jgi:hypothetical protein
MAMLLISAAQPREPSQVLIAGHAENRPRDFLVYAGPPFFGVYLRRFTFSFDMVRLSRETCNQEMPAVGGTR